MRFFLESVFSGDLFRKDNSHNWGDWLTIEGTTDEGEDVHYRSRDRLPEKSLMRVAKYALSVTLRAETLKDYRNGLKVEKRIFHRLEKTNVVTLANVCLWLPHTKVILYYAQDVENAISVIEEIGNQFPKLIVDLGYCEDRSWSLLQDFLDEKASDHKA